MEQEETLTSEEKTDRSGRGLYIQGFFTGALAAACVGLLTLTGYRMVHGGLWNGTKVSKELGASVLTDGSTAAKLAELEALIEDQYLYEVDGEVLSDYLFRGAAVGLEDAYAAYYTADELQTVLDSGKGAYYGIGVTLSENRTTGVISVAQVYEESPAWEAGLEVDDIVKAVDRESVDGIGLSELVTRIKEADGAFVLTLLRPSSEKEYEVSLECAQVQISHVKYEMLDEETGYLELLEFTQSAVSQVEEAVLSLKKQGMQRLIIDLRGNPGGLLDSVCEISDLFLEKGQRIVFMKDKNGKQEEYYAEDGRIADCPVAVLVDGYSASASEIFARMIQDYHLGVIVGTQTYGKGVVQNTFSLRDGTAFKMTVQEYYTAGGQQIDGIGIIPDLIIEEKEIQQDEDCVLQAAQEALLTWKTQEHTGGEDGE